MFEMVAESIADGGPLMYPLLLLGAVSPLLGISLYVIGAVLRDKVWALRFAIVSLALGVALPPLAWAISAWRMNETLSHIKGTVSPEDWGAIEGTAHAEMLALPWAALLSSPWLLLSGFALLGVALLRPRAGASSPPQPLRPVEG
jgi:hypothetical protein